MTRIANGLVIQNRTILLVQKRDFWILPGGKIEGDERDLEALVREFGEELPGSSLEDVYRGIPYKTFKGVSPSKKPIEVACYFIHLTTIGDPHAEITNKILWGLNSKRLDFSETTSTIIASLRTDGYL